MNSNCFSSGSRQALQHRRHICLLGEIPVYTTHIANPRLSKAVLEVLTQISDLDIDLADMDKWASDELLEDIERFLKDQGEQKGGH